MQYSITMNNWASINRRPWFIVATTLLPLISFIGKDYSDLLRIPIYLGFNSFSQIPRGTAVNRIFLLCMSFSLREGGLESRPFKYENTI